MSHPRHFNKNDLNLLHSWSLWVIVWQITKNTQLTKNKQTWSNQSAWFLPSELLMSQPGCLSPHIACDSSLWHCSALWHSVTLCATVWSVTAACHGQMTRQICVTWKSETPSDSPFSLLSISFRIGHLSRSRPLKRVWWICGMIFVEPQLKLLFSISEYSLCLTHELS